MSRSGYIDDYDDPLAMGRWRAQVMSATRGRRGQEFFKALLAALDAMSEKELIANELETPEGAVCAIGALGKARGVDMSNLDPEEPESVAATFGIASQLARETVYMNDEWNRAETPAQRWKRMRAWVSAQIIGEEKAATQ